jgi:hypothetical protein
MSGQFTLNLDKWTAKAKGRVELVVKKITFDIFSRVIYRTPVDTGAARMNWLCGVNQIRTETTEATDKGGGQAVAAAAAVIEAGGVGNVVYMVNNLPYIDALENGRVMPDGTTTPPWSKQAPNGMLRLTIQQYPGIVAAAARGGGGAP